MLQTWRLNSKGQSETHQRLAFDPETARPIVQQACNSCRVKKLRCSGERTGCFRCQTLSQKCVYAQNTTRGSARARKNRESILKAEIGARRSSTAASSSSAPSAPTPPTEPSGSISPRTECPASNSHVDNSSVQAAPEGRGSDQEDKGPIEVDMASYDPQEYPSMPSISTVQMADIEAYCGHTWLFSWPESHARVEFPTSTKTHWDGATIPFTPLPMGGWELGTHGYDDTPATPTTRNPGFESLIPEIQKSPLSLTPPATADQHGSVDDRYWLPHQALEPCQCLQRVVFLLEEIDSEGADMNVKELGSWLSRHKEALRCSEALLKCPLCQAKPENMTILAFLTDRLIAMCDEVVSAYVSALTGNVNHNSMGPKDGAWLVLVGSFEIDSPQEWSVLVSTMLDMQLRGLEAMVAQFQDLLRSTGGGEGARRKADLTRNRITGLLEKLGRPQRDHNGFPVLPCRSSSDANH
ncbi:hypothetical protein F4777DRAFT_590971 [Nemania sp. FL0916]|nr:hypothetical protein F4777DRAFT_590971 [Nemania sp. FL0916]